jgi:hypothetical protein
MAKSKARKKKKKQDKDNDASASSTSEGPSMLTIVSSWFNAASAIASAIDITRQFYKTNQTSSEEKTDTSKQELLRLQTLQRERTEETMPEDMS